MTQIIVRGYHLDGYQHVNNARYLEFLEEARWDCMSDDIDYFTQKKIAWVIVNVNINYRQPALLGQHLVFDTQISKLGSKSGVVSQVIRCRETDNVIVDALVTFVLFDMKQNKALALDGQLLEKLVSCQGKLAALSKV
ncbi:MAG: acyl-CoA thioesterase [Psychrobium sp.]|nr:acyl-CoA thioesterase [Psychrobium sp.]